ncbi:hypothetical protein OG565_33960 (plasmid) [Streptomyces sp. NBC_00138]|uniref:hypothetical protein n=1 Tax=Streptomyces sp. NBC_00138 TaxID=2903625 RepID=UPI002F9184EC
MTQQTPAQLRATAEEALKPLGQKRIKLLAQLDALDTELRPLVATAVAMEVPYRRINELTAVASNTARAWARKANPE